MGYEQNFAFVPLLGFIMSESQLEVRMYSLMADDRWKIAELVITRLKLGSGDSLKRLVHMMYGWTVFCRDTLCTMSCAKSYFRMDHRLFLQRDNVIDFNDQILKCYDYRKISGKYSSAAARRSADMYRYSDLSIRTIVDWEDSGVDKSDSLKIIAYDKVHGSHEPSYIGHFTEMLRKLQHLHLRNIVHGDMHFFNVVFSPKEMTPISSVIIDFDFAGVDGEKLYPPGFNVDITYGYRHREACPLNYLRKTHDIAAVQWMCRKYQPKNESLRTTWLECVEDLTEDDITAAIDRLANIQDVEEVELASSWRPRDVGRVLGTGSPDNNKRVQYK